MKTNLVREDDFKERRKKIAHLSDEELQAYFWELANKVVDPLIEISRTNTTPSLERSVLLRMGFSSIEAKQLVDKVIAHELIGKGAGHVVYRYQQLNKCSLREAGLALLGDEGWDEVIASWRKNNE